MRVLKKVRINNKEYIKITMSYYWEITKDLISDGINAVGVSNGDKNLKDTANGKDFSMYDDDDECYYIGRIYGSYEGFEPLDDFGMPNAGCTMIKIDGQLI